MLKMSTAAFILSFWVGAAQASTNQNPASTLHDKPYVQLDTLSYERQFIFANAKENSGEREQILTTRPTLSFYIPIHSYTLRPTLSLNPYDSSTSGSVAAGYHWRPEIEGGIFLKLNRDVKSYGEGEQKNETIESDFMLGPFIYLTPYADEEHSFECAFRFGYLYQDKRNTSNGVHTIMSEKRGAYASTQFTYTQKMRDHIFFSPNVSLEYTFANDTGQQNMMQSTLRIEAEPVSLRILF